MRDPDYDVDIGGWRGRILHVDGGGGEDSPLTIEWDSITIKKMPPSLIEASHKDDLVWSEMVLFAEDISPAQPRDDEKAVAGARREIVGKYELDRSSDDDDEDIDAENAPPGDDDRVGKLFEDARNSSGGALEGE